MSDSYTGSNVAYQNSVWLFSYCGSGQTFKSTSGGVYKLELWDAWGRNGSQTGQVCKYAYSSKTILTWLVWMCDFTL
jgi:hypothetical protein